MEYENILLLAGAVIRKAISDYQRIPKMTNPTKINLMDLKSAERFLFHPGYLETFLHTWQIDDTINVEYIRWQAKNVMLRNDTLTEQEEVLEDENPSCSDSSIE